MRRIKKNKKGFTLIELIVVVAIIAILAAVAVPQFIGMKEKANDAVAKNDASIIIGALNVHNALGTGTAITAKPAWTSVAQMQATSALGDLAPAMTDAQVVAAMVNVKFDGTAKVFVLGTTP